MAEIFGVISGAISIADVGLRLGTKMYTFGMAVAGANNAIITVSKEVTLTSSVLKELSHVIQEEHTETGIAADAAIRQTETFISECNDLFQRIDVILPVKVPILNAEDVDRSNEAGAERIPVIPPRLTSKEAGVTNEERIEGQPGVKGSKLTMAKWVLKLEPKVEALRKDLEGMKSSLLILLNVLIFARLRKNK